MRLDTLPDGRTLVIDGPIRGEPEITEQILGHPRANLVTHAYGPRAPITTPSGYVTKAFHSGVDLWAPAGIWGTAPIVTVREGVVSLYDADPWDSSGYMTQMYHYDRKWYFNYLHLRLNWPRLPAPTLVAKGGIIGGMGSTGASTGDHLHWSCIDMSMYIDPPDRDGSLEQDYAHFLDPLSDEVVDWTNT